MEAPTPSSASSPPAPSPIIETSEALARFLEALPPCSGGRHRCAVDTEADSLHSYKEKLCLIQFTCAEQHVIIDGKCLRGTNQGGQGAAAKVFLLRA